MYDKTYSINIQQATKQLLAPPKDSFNIEPSSRASILFGCAIDNHSNEIIVTSGIKVGKGNLTEVYLSQDNVILALTHELLVEMTLQVNPRDI
jgi:hypothetical protein